MSPVGSKLLEGRGGIGELKLTTGMVSTLLVSILNTARQSLERADPCSPVSITLPAPWLGLLTLYSAPAGPGDQKRAFLGALAKHMESA